MNSRERVRTALSHETPDRPPIFATFVPETEVRLRQITGIDEPDLGVALGNDMVKACAGLETSFYYRDDAEYTCPWGIGWRRVPNATGAYTEIVHHPLAGDQSKLDGFSIPDPTEPHHYAAVEEALRCYGTSKWIIGSCQISIFEAAWYLRGMDQIMMDMITDPDYVHALMDKVMEFPRVACRRFIELGVDMVWLGDDVAGQQGMLLSPELWRTFLKPRYARLFAEFKELNPDIRIAYHSCGNCMAVLEELADIGLDVINPIQPAALDPATVKQRFGKRLTLFGGLDVQHLMPFGTPDEVRRKVVELCEVCGRDGGYILAPAHHIQSDTPTQNIMALYEAGSRTETFCLP